jgi:hypothetical protein
MYLSILETYGHEFCYKNILLKNVIDPNVLLCLRLLENI